MSNRKRKRLKKLYEIDSCKWGLTAKASTYKNAKRRCSRWNSGGTAGFFYLVVEITSGQWNWAIVSRVR